jgi:imidazole glycerol-phosphate synthase subunit HisF
MIRPRIIPILLLKDSGLVKTLQFKNPKYIGDPINAIRIFNDKEVDELVLLDIDASKSNEMPDLNVLKNITSECFMPLSFGGGIHSIEMIREILKIGVEKVILNSAVVKNPNLISEASRNFGKSTIVVSIDYKKNFLHNNVYINGGNTKTKLKPIEWAIECERLGAGEIIINSIKKDGTMSGYDFDLLKSISNSVSIPVIASGGAGSLKDFSKAITNCNASAVAAGSYFVFKGKHRAVLITYPSRKELNLFF